MIISYQGIESFKVQFGEFVVAFNPISKDSTHKSARFGADIALVSINDEDCNGTEAVGGKSESFFAATGPGEYEVSDVFIKGYPSTSHYKTANRINTIYSVMLEQMHLVFLGATADAQLDSATRQALGNVDILFAPIGGDGVLDAQAAYKLAVSIEPKVIIPMHYGEVGEKNALATFLSEASAEGQKPIEKYTVKKKDLEGKTGEIVVLSSV